ncbi:MAG: mechanosensitive ion channel family protein [Deferribacteraceae bacterium]|jgi:small-conductance mechanosensitive channel|nr:mechanosensitive ion channel family protein [Deferribacteraceae bacterium]
MDQAQVQQQLTALLSTPGILKNISLSLIALLAILVLRFIFNKNVKMWKGLSVEARGRLTAGFRNFSIFAFIVINFFIWGSEVKEFAFSMAAFAVAGAMFFKEVSMNFMGGVSRSISKTYSVGDRIQVGNFRGDVIETNMLSTTVLEIGPGLTAHQYTGSSVSFPNVLLLNTPVINESFMQDYVLHVFKVPVNTHENWKLKEQCLIRAAKTICEPYLSQARTSIETMSRRISVEPPSAVPRVSIVLTDADTMDLIVRVAVPMKRKGKVEQEIIRLYLELLEDDE